MIWHIMIYIPSTTIIVISRRHYNEHWWVKHSELGCGRSIHTQNLNQFVKSCEFLPNNNYITKNPNEQDKPIINKL